MKYTHPCGLALLLSLAVSVAAHAGEAGKVEAAAPSTAVSASPADALTVVRDAATGELRAPNAQELAALHPSPPRTLSVSDKAARKAAIRAASSAVRSLPNGAHTSKLPDSLASFVIVKRLPDGSLDSKCVQGQQTAIAELSTDAPASSPAATDPPAR